MLFEHSGLALFLVLLAVTLNCVRCGHAGEANWANEFAGVAHSDLPSAGDLRRKFNDEYPYAAQRRAALLEIAQESDRRSEPMASDIKWGVLACLDREVWDEDLESCLRGWLAAPDADLRAMTLSALMQMAPQRNLPMTANLFCDEALGNREHARLMLRKYAPPEMLQQVEAYLDEISRLEPHPSPTTYYRLPREHLHELQAILRGSAETPQVQGSLRPSVTASPPALSIPRETRWSPWLIPGIFAGLGLLSLVLIVVLFRRRRA